MSPMRASLQNSRLFLKHNSDCYSACCTCNYLLNPGFVVKLWVQMEPKTTLSNLRTFLGRSIIGRVLFWWRVCQNRCASGWFSVGQSVTKISVLNVNPAAKGYWVNSLFWKREIMRSHLGNHGLWRNKDPSSGQTPLIFITAFDQSLYFLSHYTCTHLKWITFLAFRSI